MSKRIKDASEDTAGSSSLLSTIILQDLKKIRVSIGPRNRSESSSTELERDLDDPTLLRIHYRPGEGQRPIFSRADIVVNAVKYDLEKKMVRKSSRHNSPEEGRQRARRTRSCDSRSSRSYTRSPSRSSRKDSAKVKEYHRRSKSKEVTDKVNESKTEYLREPKKDVSGESDRYGSRRYSPVPGPSRHSNGDYGKDRYRKSPRRYEGSPKRYEKNRSRSRSPMRSKYGTAEREKYIRGRSSPNSKRYSRSPHTKRSRSPYQRKRTPSPHSRRRNDSPHDRVRPSQGGYGRLVHYKKPSRSPPSRRHSRSPHKTKSRASRSPYRKEKYYDRPRSRSPRSKSHHKYSSSSDRRRRSSSRSRNEQQQEMMPDFGYYGPEGFWIPAPFGRPAFLPRGVLPPPMGMPRNMMRPGQPPYIIHRQYLPMQPIPMHQFRPRYPIRYNNPNKIKISETSTTTTTATATTSTSTVTPPIEQPKVVVEEPPSDTEKK